MKKLACVLLLLVLGVSTIGAASAANPMQVPYSVPDEQVTGQMRTERLAMLEKYPGLTIVDPAAIDPGDEIIYVDGLEGLDALRSGISAIHLYTGR